MKIIFYEANTEDKLGLMDILKNYPDIQADFYEEKLSAENVAAAKDAECVSVFIHSKVNQAVIDALPNLKLITTRSTGYDHIDLKYAQTKNIAVANVPAYGSRTVAEFTFGLILGLSRKILQAFRQVKDSHDFDISHFKGFNLQGKTLGVVGTGRIGLNVIQIAKGFDMNILGFDAFPNEAEAKALGFTYKPLNELLANSDIITLHVPYNKDTHHLINKDNVPKIKKGAVLINTSRGEVTDTEAVLIGVKEKILGGVGLDVLEGEKELLEECAFIAGNDPKNDACSLNFKVLLEDHMLINLPEVAITPHIAFFSKEAKQEILKITVENILGYSNNKQKNVITNAQ
ncbi:MAG: hydroxyacid dehydrogenase [Candidatus Doudnabacteria bacterium]|nr:hydroxyacid dehydrogenase [Candidatus Doudnabacteria bacterium]